MVKLITFFIVFGLTIATLFIPDPLFLVDEIVGIVATVVLYKKLD